MRALVRVLLMAVITALVSTSPLWAQSEEKTVYVSVVDKSGAPVAGLPVSEFIVREDDVAREVLRASVAKEPLQIALLIDTSQAMDEHVADLRRALGEFVKLMGGKHEIALIGTGERPTILVDYTRDVARLEKEVAGLFARPGSGTHIMDSIIAASDGLRLRKAARPVIINITATGPEFSTPSHTHVLERLRESGASLHSLALVRPGVQMPSNAEEQALTLSIADGTRMSGGRRDDLLTSMALTGRLQQLGNELNAQYQITYARPRTLLPPNAIAISVKRPDLTVRARHWP